MPFISHYEDGRFEYKRWIVGAFERVDEYHDEAVGRNKGYRCVDESSEGPMRRDGKVELAVLA